MAFVGTLRGTAVAIALFIAAATYAGNAPALTVSLMSTADHVTLSGDVTLRVLIENTTDQPVFVFGDLRWGDAGGLVLHVGPWDETGPLPFVVDHGSFMKDEVTADSLVKLNPHMFLGKTRRIAVKDIVRHAGKYRLWVEYRSPVQSSVFDLPFWSAEKGSLVSHAIVFNVR